MQRVLIIERDVDFPDESGWRGELRRMRGIAERVAGEPSEVAVR